MEVPRRQFGWRFLLGAMAVFLIWFFFIQTRSLELTVAEQTTLLQLAREQLVAAAAGGGTIEVDESALSARLLQPGAAFVTLTIDGALRGCMIDSFDAHESLYRNVLHNTTLAARGDERFPPIMPEESRVVRIAISVLSPLVELEFGDPEELLAKLKPGIDGVTLRLEDGLSTYLPEVWETYPDPGEFLSRLSEKAGLPSDRWREEPYPAIATYRTFRFEEP